YHSLLRRLSHQHAERARALTDAFNSFLPDFKLVPISGGSSCWVQAPETIDTQRLAEAALQEGVVIEPGHVFYHRPDASNQNYLRLGFASIAQEKIPAGIARLAKVYQALKEA